MLRFICDESRLYNATCFLLAVSCFCMFILSLPLLGLGSKSTCLSPGFCVCRPRKFKTICLKLDLISRFFVFSWLIVCADRINDCGWCLAGGRGSRLKGPNKLYNNIYHHFLYFHLSYSFDCLICAKDIMIIALLLDTMKAWEGCVCVCVRVCVCVGGSIFVRVGLEHRGFVIFCSVFEVLLIALSWLAGIWQLLYLFRYLLLVHEKCCVCLVKLFQKSGQWSGDFLEKGRVPWFQSLFSEFALFYTSELHHQARFIISACWFVIPIYSLQE